MARRGSSAPSPSSSRSSTSARACRRANEAEPKTNRRPSSRPPRGRASDADTAARAGAHRHASARCRTSRRRPRSTARRRRRRTRRARSRRRCQHVPSISRRAEPSRRGPSRTRRSPSRRRRSPRSSRRAPPPRCPPTHKTMPLPPVRSRARRRAVPAARGGHELAASAAGARAAPRADSLLSRASFDSGRAYAPPRRRVGGWIVALVLVAGVSVLGFVVAQAVPHAPDEAGHVARAARSEGAAAPDRRRARVRRRRPRLGEGDLRQGERARRQGSARAARRRARRRSARRRRVARHEARASRASRRRARRRSSTSSR